MPRLAAQAKVKPAAGLGASANTRCNGQRARIGKLYQETMMVMQVERCLDHDHGDEYSPENEVYL